ncbi:MAG TPA: toll/interleukin-1 receptor domain-containing protein, partial [Burkholderiaceae bacterium]
RIASACADHAAGRGRSPQRGAGPSAGGAPSGRGELIEDEAPAAGAFGALAQDDVIDTLSIPSSGPPPLRPALDISLPAAAHPTRTERESPAAPPAAPSTRPGDAAVFCPPIVARGTVFLVQALLHGPERASEARERALEADATTQRRGVLALPSDLPLGTRLDLHLEMPALQVDEPDASLVWTGHTCAAQFEVAVPAAAALGNTIGRVRLAVAGVPIGTLRFQLTVAAADAATQPPRDAGAEVRRYHRAFVSYASSDRAEVLHRVQAFRIAGIAVFQDVLDLEPGQRWERELYREIDRCDVVFLFWSTAASASPWVAKEIDYALTLKCGEDDRPPEIAPVPIEGPPIPPPPERLKHLHFYDALLAHIAVARLPPRP